MGGAVALGRRVQDPAQGGVCSDGKREFGEDRFELAAGFGVESEFVVAAAQVLDELVPATDDLGGGIRFRPRIGRVRAFNRP